MRIGFDAKRAFLNQTGLGNYSRSLLRSLAEFYPDNEYFLYTPRAPQNEIATPFSKPPFQVRIPPKLTPAAIWRSGLMAPQLKKDQLDIFHGLSHEIPFGIKSSNIRTIVTIHDLIFLRYPELYPFIDRKIYFKKVRYACCNADTILAVSKQTKRDIIHFLEIPPEKIKVVYQSCGEQFLKKYPKPALATFKEEYHLPKTFLLSVGTIEERKNLLLIAKAMKTLPEAIQCVVFGKKKKYFETVFSFLQKEKLVNRFLFLSGFPYEKLPLLYQSAAVFVYPSRFEGFGIPVLEALSSGTPVIAASGSCLEEVGGPDSIYIHPDDEKALSVAVSDILTDEALSQTMSQKGMCFAQRFLPRSIARDLMGIYTGENNHSF